MNDEQADKIIELLEKMIEQNEDILEKIANISTPGVDFGVYDDD